MATLKLSKWRLSGYTFTVEVLSRVLLLIIGRLLNLAEPFDRHIHFEELWLYKYPTTEDYVPTWVLWIIVILLPGIILLLHYLLTQNSLELYNGMMAFSLALALNGVLVNTFKIIIGRPRPDFLQRCFPDGSVKLPSGDPDGSLELGGLDFGTSCTGDPAAVIDGKKSFPSGHSAFAFCGLGFMSAWLSHKLHMRTQDRGEAWRLLLCLSPLFAASLVAASRTCDYHHHWQDVVVGSLLGASVMYVCYRQYYPSVFPVSCCANQRPSHDSASSSSSRLDSPTYSARLEDHLLPS
ncbi:Phosphatidic acid phosphatase type 2/haloperoxidase [Trinorchestia longiramus]|nr:Phosphatidic acid phosphatase type 2/haloperoxidase [Trinorchestia longiramus]